jgi:hypothetical protein
MNAVITDLQNTPVQQSKKSISWETERKLGTSPHSPRVYPWPAVDWSAQNRPSPAARACSSELSRRPGSGHSDLLVEPPMRTVVWRAPVRRQPPRRRTEPTCSTLIGLRPKRKVRRG